MTNYNYDNDDTYEREHNPEAWRAERRKAIR